MISAARTNEPRPGFTLIELVIVIAIAAVVMGGAFGYMVYSAEERTLRDASGEIQLLAKRARTISILHQTPYALEFREGVVRLMPFAQAGWDEKKISRDRDPEFEGGEAAATESRQINLEGGLNVFVRRWNSDAWLSTNKNTVHVWRFDPDGLCEPIGVRLTYGESWAEDTYHPLTASISDSQLEAR